MAIVARGLGNFAAVLVMALALPATAVTTESAALAPLGHAVFRVEARDSYGRVKSGSAVLVAAQTVVTNCHVVLSTDGIAVTGADSRVRLPARVIRAHPERDLCLLAVPGIAGTIATLGSTMNKRAGHPIVAMGYPVGGSLILSRGHIEGLFTYRGPGRVVQGSAHFKPGESGGALFDADNMLIGILTFKCRGGGPYHFAVPVEWVAALLREPDKGLLQGPAAPFWKLTDERQPLFLQAMSLLADGECHTLQKLAAKWLAREPNNPEAQFMVWRAQRCNMIELIQRPQLEK